MAANCVIDQRRRTERRSKYDNFLSAKTFSLDKMSWFKRKRDSGIHDDTGEEERTSHERPIPRNENDEVVTERTRLLGHEIEPEVQPSPYNLAAVRSLRNISMTIT